MGKNAGNWEKDVFLTKQTRLSIESKGLSFLKGQKQTGF
jgi:hypothetical protein